MCVLHLRAWGRRNRDIDASRCEREEAPRKHVDEDKITTPLKPAHYVTHLPLPLVPIKHADVRFICSYFFLPRKLGRRGGVQLDYRLPKSVSKNEKSVKIVSVIGIVDNEEDKMDRPELFDVILS